MSMNRRSRSLEHIASALVPPAAFAAVPNTPPLTPSPSGNKKKFWKRKKPPRQSPLMPTLLGVTMTARAIGLGMDTPSARSSPDRSLARDTSLESQREDVDATYATVQKRGRNRNRNRRQIERNFVVEDDIVPSVAQGNMEPKKNERTRPKVISGERAASMSDVREIGYELEEKQRQLEERVQMQHDETRDMVKEVMTRQHEDLLRRSQQSEAPYDLQDLDEDNQVLMDENSRLIQQNTSLVEENRHLYAVSSTLKSKGKKGSPRAQVEQLISENDILRETVQRLTTELDKFQDKYGNLPNKSISGIQIETDDFEPKPKWLNDVDYLSPLFVSYDAQLKEKNGIIRMLKNHQDPDTKRRWENLSEQNNLMTEEIQILMQQMEIAKEKATQSSKDHAKEAAKLSKELAVAQAEAEVSVEMVAKLQKELDLLKKEHQKLLKESAEKIPAKEHIATVNELKREMELAKDTAVKEMAETMKKIKTMEEERTTLTMELTESQIKVKKTEGQIDSITQAYDKSKDKCKALDDELEHMEKRNAECETHLAEVLRLVDKATAERDALAALIDKEQRISEQALRRTMLGKWEMGKMEQAMKQYKMQAASHMNEITDKIRDLEETHEGKLMQYNREMAHLRRILHEKQAALDDVTHEKKLMESELENVWQAATSENRRILEVFSKSRVLE